MASWRHRVLDLLRGLPAASPLALALALRRPGRLPLFLSDCLRAYRQHAGLRIPAITPWELLDFKGVATLRLGENGIHAASETSFVLAQLAAMLAPRRIFEIGTSQGRTTALLAMNAPADAEILTLDLPPEAALPPGATDRHLVELARRELGIAFRGTAWEARITQLLGDSSGFDFSPYRDAIDLVIVDASHSYPFVASDSWNAFRMVRPGGVVVWDDYESMRSEYGVSRFVDRLRHVHGAPVFRLGRDPGDSRKAAMRVDERWKRDLVALADHPERFRA